MYGAIIGDLIASGCGARSGFTGDTVMTVAVAEALMNARGKSPAEVRGFLADSMREWTELYPCAGSSPSLGVAAAGWLFGSLAETRCAARLVAEVARNRPEALRGAEAAASVIWLARSGFRRADIRDYVTWEFGCDLSRPLRGDRPEGFSGAVADAVAAFLGGRDFEDTVRLALVRGGSGSAVPCLAGSMAEALYRIPEGLRRACVNALPGDMRSVLVCFDHMRAATRESRPLSA